jgi:hypothetical protein
MHGFLLLSFKELWFLKSGPVLFSVDINITIVFQLALRFWQSIIFLRTCSFFFFDVSRETSIIYMKEMKPLR